MLGLYKDQDSVRADFNFFMPFRTNPVGSTQATFLSSGVLHLRDGLSELGCLAVTNYRLCIEATRHRTDLPRCFAMEAGRSQGIIFCPTKTSALRETAEGSPCRLCRRKSTRSRQAVAGHAEGRLRWTGSVSFFGRVPAGSNPHRCEFFPSPSIGPLDRRNRLTLPPWEIGYSGQLSKKLANNLFSSQKTTVVGNVTELCPKQDRQPRIHVKNPDPS